MAALRLVAPYRLLPACLFHTLTGWPCLTCGGTRSLTALASGHLAAALRHNPLVALAAVGILATGVLGLAERAARRPLLSPRPVLRHQALLQVALGALALANWAYLIVWK